MGRFRLFVLFRCGAKNLEIIRKLDGLVWDKTGNKCDAIQVHAFGKRDEIGTLRCIILGASVI